MAKVRVIGPSARLPEALVTLQDFALLQLAAPPSDPTLGPASLSARDQRCQRQLLRIQADLDVAQSALAFAGSPGEAPSLPRIARYASRMRQDAERLVETEHALIDERTSTLKYRDLFAAFHDALGQVARTPSLATHAFVVPARERSALTELTRALSGESTLHYSVVTHDLPNGDVALLLLVPTADAAAFQTLVAHAGLPELGLPAAYAGRPLAEAMPLMVERLGAVERELAIVRARRSALHTEAGPTLAASRAAIHARLARLEAVAHCAATPHAFALDGWVPSKAVADLRHRLDNAFGPAVVLEIVSRDEWKSDAPPVALTNPRIFRPFETIVRLMPLPHYGTIDPTPFVAVSFPMFFGMILGDVGYGAILAALAAVLHAQSRPGTWQRTVAEIAGPCAAFAIIFGALYTEVFGTVGRGWLPWPPLLDRERATLASLAAAVGLGLAHVVLGLVLGVVASWRGERRQAIGRGATALMLLLITAALLAAFRILPHALFTPAVIALLVTLPVLVFAEGALGVLELLSTLGNVLSYARIMALGTASVMMATVANRLGGVVGSTVFGVALALLFHLVNFGLGLFSPTIQALRLQYVEFFHQFYSPGGRPYRPFAR